MIIPSMSSLSSSCFSMPDVSVATQLFYRVTLVKSHTFALNYPLPTSGHESFDYHPLLGKFFIGNKFNQEVTAFDPTSNAMASRPNLAGGRGYPSVETYTLASNTSFSFGLDNQVADNLRRYGLSSLGCRVDYGYNSQSRSSRTRVWLTRVQFFNDFSSSPYGGASVLDFSVSPPAQV